MSRTDVAGEDAPPLPRPGDGFEKNGEKYVVCGAGKCTEAHEGNEIWCINEKDCPRPDRPDDPCHCILFRAKRILHRRRTDFVKWEADPNEPTWDSEGKRWKYPYDPENYWYACVCARKL